MKTSRYWLVFLSLCFAALLFSLWLRAGTDASPFTRLESLAAQFEDWLRQSERDYLEVSSAMEAPEVAAASLGHHTSAPSKFDHTIQDEQVCARPRTKSRREVDRQVFYRWVDDNGQTHMADQRPEGRIATVLDLGRARQDFSYEIVAEDIQLPQNFEGQIIAGSKRMYDIWHFLLGEQRLRQSRIRLLMLGNPTRFDAYYGSVAPGRGAVQGFYRMGKNEAVVKASSADPARNLAIAFHEISHLITASHLGPTPPWLTEGLAEYFETLEVRDQTGTIRVNEAHIALLDSIALPALENYFSIGREQWYGSERSLHYAIAWSLTHFLLEGAPGMYALQRVVQQAEARFCQPFSAVAELNSAYPGGLRRLEQDWRQWLMFTHKQIHQI